VRRVLFSFLDFFFGETSFHSHDDDDERGDKETLRYPQKPPISRIIHRI
jgi:hypothetical protein